MKNDPFEAAVNFQKKPDRARAKEVVATPAADPRAWVVEEIRDREGGLRAVKICSALLQGHIYVTFDPDFIPEPLAIYWSEEIEVMAQKSPETVLEIHKVKIVFPGARVVQ